MKLKELQGNYAKDKLTPVRYWIIITVMNLCNMIRIIMVYF